MTTRRVAVLVAAALGAIVSGLGQPVWQDALEPAQVLAGLVVYPSDAPVGVYSTHTWTLLHQVPALAFRLGFDERTITTLISAALGALAAGALSLVVALGRPSPIVIACAPLLILLSGFTKFQTGYPVGLFGLPYTYGAAAQSLAVLTLALLAHGRTRSALLMLGLFPAVHIALGGLLWLVVGLAALTHRDDGPALPWRWWLIGVAAAGASAFVHHIVWVPSLASGPPLLPGLDTSPAALAPLIDGARTYWDSHRGPMAWTNPSIYIALAVPVATRLAWRRMPALPAPSQWWPAVLLAALVVGLVGAGLGALWPASPVATVMPTRLWNLGLFTALATSLGLGLSPWSPPWIRAWAAGVLGLLALLHTPTPAPLPDLHGAIRTAVEATSLSNMIPVAGTAAALGALLVALATSRTRLGSHLPQLAGVSMPVSYALLALFTAMVAMTTMRGASESLAALAPPPALVMVRDRPGALLTAGDLHLIQGMTRRPVVLDGGALDFLPYVPTAAPMTDRILRDLYNASLTSGPPDWGPAGTLPIDGARTQWEDRAFDEWRSLADRWQFTDIVTPSDWRLRLPLLARDADVAVWTIR